MGLTMDIKGIIKVNIINVILLGLVALVYYIFNTVFEFSFGITLAVTLILGLVWMAYTLYSNYMMLNSEKEHDDDIDDKNYGKMLVARLRNAGNKKYFTKEREALIKCYESVLSRKDYLAKKNRDNKIYDLYTLTERQIQRNIIDTTEYIATYDYVRGGDNSYITKMCYDSEQLVDKFNRLMELSVSYDDTSLGMDTRELDDMISSLEYMRDIGKGRLRG
jgi:hypothetical protein